MSRLGPSQPLLLPRLLSPSPEHSINVHELFSIPSLYGQRTYQPLAMMFPLLLLLLEASAPMEDGSPLRLRGLGKLPSITVSEPVCSLGLTTSQDNERGVSLFH